jgi:predicted dithiol-disulfide oxidoreductase (DUF899 family)
MRRALPKGSIMPKYEFDEGSTDLQSDQPTTKTTLADLVADGRSVVLYYFMYDPADAEPCRMCSLTVDNFNSIGKRLAQTINFAIIAKGQLAPLRDWAKKRGWDNLRILSSNGNSFNSAMKVEKPAWDPDFNQIPGVSVFKKDDEGNVRHVYTTYTTIEPGNERGMDLLTTTCNVLDLTPEGRGQ